MELAEIITKINEYEEKDVIFTSTSHSSEYQVFSGDIENIAGFEYFLEVDLAKEILDVWRQWNDGLTPTTEQSCGAIIYYAENDAFIESS